jgi:uncharacterized membrane protein (DUF2068 family)
MRAPAGNAPRRIDGLRLIGLFKVGKALLLLLTTYGIYQLLDAELVDRLHEWVYSLTDNFERRLLTRGLEWINTLSPAHIGSLVVVTSLYTCVLLVEGLGLWFRQVWAEWLTVIASASLIPFELAQIVGRGHQHRLAVTGAMVLNVVIVLYLVHMLRRRRDSGQAR